MNSFRGISVALVMVGLLALTAAQSEPQPQTALPVGSAVVTEMKGEVVFTSPEGAPLTAQPGQSLMADTRIETAKGSVLLQLQDGSQILIKAHSNVVLRVPTEGKGYFLELFIGKIMTKIQKRMGSAPSFKMGTPSAVITVRGTRFSVEVNRTLKTHVEVFDGLVEVAGLAQGFPPVLLQPRFSTGVEPGRGPEQPQETNSGEGFGRGDSREGPGQGKDREDQQRNQSQPRNQRQGSDGKPD
jgi:ferric-dicitrate binding protein FerR (iron transport regulator)